MAKYKMKFFGALKGKVSKKSFHFDKGSVVEAEKGDFDEVHAELIVANPSKKAEKKPKVEKATKEPK